MTIEDFRKKTRELLWTNGIKEAFEDELNLMLDRLFQLFQKFFQHKKIQIFEIKSFCKICVDKGT